MDSSIIHTLGGLFDETGEPVNGGLPLELVERLMAADRRTAQRRIGRTQVLNVDPWVYRQVVQDWLAEEPRITCLTNTALLAVTTAQRRIEQVGLQHGDSMTWVATRTVVDASGEGAAVRRIDPTLLEPGEALAGWVAVLTGIVPGALAFPKGAALVRRIRTAAAAGTLPQDCGNLWVDSGIADDEIYLKFTVSAATFDPAWSEAVLAVLLPWLRGLPEFAGAVLSRCGSLGVRDGGRVRGRYRLTEADVRAGRRFEDAVCAGCWPIEHWHPERGIQLDYLPHGTRYQIPLRSLTVADIDGLYAVGKCLSAEPRAQASARVVGTCWGMGAGLGKWLCPVRLE